MDIARFEAPADPPRPDWPQGRETPPPPSREPLFNAPWPALAVVGAIVVAYAWQTSRPDAVVVPSLGFSAAALAAGQWWTLVTAQFLHGSWTHALLNAAFALAFATPVARLYGTGPRGALAFFAFYLACGAVSNLAYSLLHPGGLAILVGASGAVSGLMGAAARIIAGEGRLGGMFSRSVLTMGAAWVAVNLIFAVVGGAMLPGTGGAAIAWEAHLAGFLAGVLLAGPFAWASGRR